MYAVLEKTCSLMMLFVQSFVKTDIYINFSYRADMISILKVSKGHHSVKDTDGDMIRILHTLSADALQMYQN